MESSEKSSIDAGSEGEVMLSPEMSGEIVIDCSGWRVAGVAFAVALGACCEVPSVSRVRSVGRFGVDLDWKPVGTVKGFTDSGLGGVPLL